ncbi:MAG: SpoVA/SpoVAEb family sporulation membrane protein [Ruminococcus sp.]
MNFLQNHAGSDRTPVEVLKNIPLAFLIGGLICTIGEAGIHILTEYCGMEQKNASAWVSIGLVAVSAVCTRLGW